jgi:hypothetical protein
LTEIEGGERYSGKGAFGNTELVLSAEVAPEVMAGALVGEELLVGGEDFGGLGFVFFEEFDAVAAEAGGVELGVEVGAGLGLVIEEGVATADVGFQRVVDAHAVA